MKKVMAVALLSFAAVAQAGDYQHYSAMLQICKMQAKIAMMIAHADATGETPVTRVEDYRNGDPGLYELVRNMDRIAKESGDAGLQIVGERAGAWCMDNVEQVVFKHRR